jgi:tetratricopeptide (TPR) repeat protein
MNGTNFNQRANELYERAEKTMKGSFFGNFMRGRQDRADDSKELYLQAANCYKLSNDFNRALHCYEKCIECEENDADQAVHYREAA